VQAPLATFGSESSTKLLDMLACMQHGKPTHTSRSYKVLYLVILANGLKAACHQLEPFFHGFLLVKDAAVKMVSRPAFCQESLWQISHWIRYSHDKSRQMLFLTRGRKAYVALY
jgi:hypothetical protein